jgi:hypothetical protein
MIEIPESFSRRPLMRRSGPWLVSLVSPGTITRVIWAPSEPRNQLEAVRIAEAAEWLESDTFRPCLEER